MMMDRPPKRLRVAVVTETYPPEVNGVARTISLMVEALLARGHAVQLVRPRQGDEAPSAREGFSQWLTRGVPIPRYGSLQLGLVAVSRLEANWRQWQPDVVQVATEGPLGWTALRAAARLGIGVATDFHTNFHAYSRDYGIGPLASAIAKYLRHFHNRTDCTMVPTLEMQAALARLGFQRLCVVGRGIDTALFHPARRSEALRRSWGCGPGDLVVLQVGRLAPEKNLPLFTRAIESMRACNPALKVVIVGEGPLAAVMKKDHPSFVFAGLRLGEDLAAHYASADLFLFPSTTETYGNVTLEAMASGLPLVAYDYAAAREHILPGAQGLLAPLGDELAFVGAATRLSLDPHLRIRLGSAAREAAEGLSWERSFDALEAVLSKVAHQRRDSALAA